MESKTVNLGIIGKILMLFIVLNIVGEVGNVIFWLASPDSRALSLNTSIIGNAAGADAALIAGTIILLAVAAAYTYAFFGLMRKKPSAPLIVIAVSIVNRILALLLYAISPAFAFWAVWTAILVVVAFLVWRKMKA